MIIDVLLILSFIGLVSITLYNIHELVQNKKNELGIIISTLFLTFVFFGIIVFSTMSKATDYNTNDITKSEMLFVLQLNNISWIIFLLNFFLTTITLIITTFKLPFKKDRLRKGEQA